MTATKITPRVVSDPLPVRPAGRPLHVPDAGWAVTRASQVRAVLGDPNYEVASAQPGGSAGSVAWLRSSVSRFTNGAEHARRRARTIAELDRLPPAHLRAEAEALARAVMDAAAAAGQIDLMASVARRVPTAVLAARLGFPDASRAADAVCILAPAYFPGASADCERAADAATAELAGMLAPAAEEEIVTRIQLLVQGCDATAALIGKAVCRVLPPLADARARTWPTDAILAEVLRYDPPLRVSRRVSRQDARLDGHLIAAGSAVLLHVDSANRDPEVCAEPETFDPGRTDGSNLTFGSGLRPCPGQQQATMLAAGVVDAVRDQGTVIIGPVEYEPQVNLRIPARLKVGLR
jgi:cytochrome P450